MSISYRLFVFAKIKRLAHPPDDSPLPKFLHSLKGCINVFVTYSSQRHGLPAIIAYLLPGVPGGVISLILTYPAFCTSAGLRLPDAAPLSRGLTAKKGQSQCSANAIVRGDRSKLWGLIRYSARLLWLLSPLIVRDSSIVFVWNCEFPGVSRGSSMAVIHMCHRRHIRIANSARAVPDKSFQPFYIWRIWLGFITYHCKSIVLRNRVSRINVLNWLRCA